MNDTELYGLQFIIGVLFTWGVGLSVPLLLRFAVLRRQMGRGSALAVVAVLWLLQFIFYVGVQQAAGDKRVHSHVALILVAVASYLILRKRDSSKDAHATQSMPGRSSTADQLSQIALGAEAPRPMQSPSAAPGTAGGLKNSAHVHSQALGSRSHYPAEEMPLRQDMERSPIGFSLSDGSEDRIYDRIAQELESGATERATWTRAFAEADGDDRNARVLYIKLRFAKLIAEERERLAAVARAKEQERARRGLIEREEFRRQSLAEAARLGGTMLAARFRIAVRTGDLSAVREALARDGLLVNATDSDGFTPLMLAADEGNTDIAKLLVDYGAATDLTNHYGRTARSIADKKGHVGVIAVIDAHCSEQISHAGE